jgi:hypothetical protein
MSPEKQNSQGKNICPKATAGCKAACLFTAGRGKFSNVMKGRMNKTEYFLQDRKEFMLQVAQEIAKGIKKHGANAMCVRLNGTSDIPYENIAVAGFDNIMSMFPDVQFYDYTKHPSRNLTGKTCNNYDLTFSFSAITPKPISIKGLTNPHNSRAAVVFQKRADIPIVFRNWTVVDGDDTDVRHIEPKSVVVALYAKGKAKNDTSGFTQIKGIHYA